MSSSEDRRGKYRRYADRRVAVMLALHEILFDQDPGPARDALLLEEMMADFETDAAVFLRRRGDPGPVALETTAAVGATQTVPDARFCGDGLRNLLSVQQSVQGAVTLSRFRRPSMLDAGTWDSLWETDLGLLGATGLLSIDIVPRVAPPFFLWLVLVGSSREWTSHDRDLAEEIARLLAKAADKSFRSP